MINPLFYSPDGLSSLLLPNSLQRMKGPASLTAERTLLEAVLHMFLGLPSQLFPLKDDSFEVNSQSIQLSHISKSLLTCHLQQLLVLANQMQSLRKWIIQLYHLPHALLQAFGIGLHDLQRSIEETLCTKLTLLHEQSGDLQRTSFQKSSHNTLSMLGLPSCLKPEVETLNVLQKIMSTYPTRRPVNMDELNRWGVFLLNFYFQEWEKEYLFGQREALEVAFKRCLVCYLKICQAWACFDEKSLQCSQQSGFFINLTKALSLNGERFFKISKIVHEELIPSILVPHYKQLIELGKTVQFIKFYLAEQDLLLFSHFLAPDEEFSPLTHFLSKDPLPHFQAPANNNFTISSRSRDRSKNLKSGQRLPEEEDPFSVDPTAFPFISLRKARRFRDGSEVKEKVMKEERWTPRTEMGNKNNEICNLLGTALESMTLKCKIVMKEHKIKNSILQALQAIKNFVLLGKGDFLQEFIELSESLLDRPTDKISPNSVHNLIEEAAKASSCHQLYSNIKEELSFVFLRGDPVRTKGWRSFSLTFKSRPPISFIFHGEAMYDYECVGNLLFCLRKCEHILVNFWRKSFLVGSAPLEHLRTAVHRLVVSIETYLFSIIEDFWSELLAVFESCNSVLELLEANNHFLNRLKEVTTESQPLSNAMLSLLKLVEQFQSLWIKMEEGNIQSLGKEIRQLWEWFMSLLDQARLLQPLAGSLNFDFASLQPELRE